jgi:NADPH:quinone reductase-like Zn-dependent oxidoreductase
MKAIQCRGYGGPDQLAEAEVPVPQPVPSQLLIRVAASSVNPVDWKLYSGRYRWLMSVRFPAIPGFDVAGEVTEVGAQVTRFKPGNHIFAMLDTHLGGASADYAVMGERAVARLPAKMPAHGHGLQAPRKRPRQKLSAPRHRHLADYSRLRS